MTNGAGTLPQGWTTGQSKDGRTFFINHNSKTTTWEHPENAAPPPDYFEATTNLPAPASVYPVAGVAAFRPPQAVALPGSSPQVQVGSYAPLMRRIFWVSAGQGWVVWIFSVSSAGDQNWMTSYDGSGYGIDDVNNNCDGTLSNDSACAACEYSTSNPRTDCVYPGEIPRSLEDEAFVATQIFATITCSVAVVIYTFAFFRPFEAQLGSTKVLGLAGGILMALATFFQMLAFIFAAKRVQENVEEWGEGYFERGPTYGIGVATFVFGLIQATLIFLSFWAAGDGPLLSLALELTAPKEVNIPVSSPQIVASKPQGTQPVANMSQVPRPEASGGEGAIAANPPQLNNSNAVPPPYESPKLGPKPSQPTSTSEGPPPAYDSADIESTTV